MKKKEKGITVKWRPNTEDNKPQLSHSVLIRTANGIAEGELLGENWLQYRWTAVVKDNDVLAWMELSDLMED